VGVANPFNVSMCPYDAVNWTALLPSSAKFTPPICGMKFKSTKAKSAATYSKLKRMVFLQTKVYQGWH